MLIPQEARHRKWNHNNILKLQDPTNKLLVNVGPAFNPPPREGAFGARSGHGRRAGALRARREESRGAGRE